MEALFNQAAKLHRAGRLDEAEAIYRQITDSKSSLALNNLGVVLRATGRLEEAEAVLRRAVAAEPHRASPRFMLGMTLLGLGNYAEGWRYFEARRTVHPSRLPPLPFPEWQGENLTGKHLLVFGEQGFGDQILFARFIPQLAQQAARVTLCVARRLVPLLTSLPAHVFYPDNWAALRADYWIHMETAPLYWEMGPEDAPAPYLAQAPRRVSGVGLMLQGDPRNENNANRLPGAEAAREIRGLAPFVDLAPEATGAKDFVETAEIIAGLEMVVTVDTSVAHLAGAMGKPTLLLMGRPAMDWYTNWHDDRSPWYPSIRSIRQPRAGDWKSVVARLGLALAEAGLAD